MNVIVLYLLVGFVVSVAITLVVDPEIGGDPFARWLLIFMWPLPIFALVCIYLWAFGEECAIPFIKDPVGMTCVIINWLQSNGRTPNESR